MAEADVRKPLPAITTEAKPFWDAAAQNKLVMQRCQDCGAWVWTPRPLCNECGSERIEWTPMSGKGEIYSFTVIRQVVGRAASKAFEPDIPYVIAWVDLDEGPRMITNIVGCPVEDVQARHESFSRVRASRRKFGCRSSSRSTKNFKSPQKRQTARNNPSFRLSFRLKGEIFLCISSPAWRLGVKKKDFSLRSK